MKTKYRNVTSSKLPRFALTTSSLHINVSFLTMRDHAVRFSPFTSLSAIVVICLQRLGTDAFGHSKIAISSTLTCVHSATSQTKNNSCVKRRNNTNALALASTYDLSTPRNPLPTVRSTLWRPLRCRRPMCYCLARHS